MVQENEIVTLFLAFAVVLFAGLRRRELDEVPRVGLLRCAFLAFLTSWVATVAEGFLLPEALNLVEHAAFSAGTLLLAWWLVATGSPAREGRPPCS